MLPLSIMIQIERCTHNKGNAATKRRKNQFQKFKNYTTLGDTWQRSECYTLDGLFTLLIIENYFIWYCAELE